MTPPSNRELMALRSWRTWLLGLGGAVQGVQYFANPSYPLTTPTLTLYHQWGTLGWSIFGSILAVAGLWLLFPGDEWDILGYLIGLGCYATLAVAGFASHIVPAFALVIGGLNAGEVALRVVKWYARKPVRRRKDG